MWLYNPTQQVAPEGARKEKNMNVWLHRPGDEEGVSTWLFAENVTREEAMAKLEETITTNGVVPDFVDEVSFSENGTSVEKYHSGDTIR